MQRGNYYFKDDSLHINIKYVCNIIMTEKAQCAAGGLGQRGSSQLSTVGRQSADRGSLRLQGPGQKEDSTEQSSSHWSGTRCTRCCISS